MSIVLSGPMKIQFSDSLPINQRRDEIAELIRHNQVVIVAGETGSGKTTQLPKICLSLGLAENGLIGHTQPRRIAARTVANRIASELEVQLGNEVGYQVRFTDQSNKKTQLKLMTDGVLLAEIQRDRLLKKYSVIIIDEAHERSLNIDFLLGLLKPLCLKRPDLKVIITSATIDLEKFANHFATRASSRDSLAEKEPDAKRPAPIIEVSGRTYPVKTVYRPPNEDESLASSITRTIKHIAKAEAKSDYNASGDILVFCSGEREIRDASQSISQAQLPVEVLPLYSRLSIQEQNRIFQPAHRRKVVLATNVAETSITVPGIAYVIDPGLARISRYSFRSKIQRLPIERISQASANQRQGRCGRVANGVCIRLYSQEDFEQRPEFTQAEIMRSNLASVILKMMRLNIQDISKFDFLDRPDSRLLNDGRKLLAELQAIETKTNKKNNKTYEALTPIGLSMSDLPIEPRFARVLFAANKMGCLRDALVLISVLSIQDPRERPSEHQQAADLRHKELEHHQSDFFGYLYLWQAVNNQRQELSNSKFKELCRQQFWSIARIFEWREMVGQLSKMCKAQGWKIEPWQSLELPTPEAAANAKKNANKAPKFDARYTELHQALLCGMLGNIATKDVEGNYLATQNRQISLFPSSSLAKQKPAWIVAGEYLETSRVFAVNVAQITPTWLIESAAHLIKYSYSSARYDVRSGSIKALRKTLFKGLTLKDKELVNYSQINRGESRELFISEALVGGKYQPRGNKAQFVKHNKKLITEIESLESKTRRRNLLIDDSQIFDFYSERIPEDICSRAGLEKWLARNNEETLKFTQAQLLAKQLNADELSQFPNVIAVQGKQIKLSYSFSPHLETDGVTMHIPISVLAPFPNHIGDWLVPGILREKCIALIKTLPKTIRKHYAPASDSVDRIMPKLQEANGSQALTQVLADILFRTRGIKVTQDDFDETKLDAYYRVNYLIIDVDGSIIEQGSDLDALKQAYADKVRSTIHASGSEQRQALEQPKLDDWSFGELKKQITYQHKGMTVHAFPALLVNPDQSIDLKILDDENVARYRNHFGITALAKQVLANGAHKQTYKHLKKEIMRAPAKSKNKGNQKDKVVPKNGLGQLASQLKKLPPALLPDEQWADEIIECSLSFICLDHEPNKIKTKDDFHIALAKAKLWMPHAKELESTLVSALKARSAIFKMMEQHPAQSIEADTAHEDIKAQLYRLFEPHFLRYTSLSNLQQYPRYIKAIESRLARLGYFIDSPLERALQSQQERFNDHCHEATPSELERDFPLILDAHLCHFRILLEEWRVSIYAQQLRTQHPVSDKRLNKYWDEYIA